MMPSWVLLIVGGVLGTVGRYVLAGAVYARTGAAFPYGTLAVNILGCLVIGFLSTLADRRSLLTPEFRLFWMIGLLGAFTTFSTLIYESWRLMQDGQMLLAGTNLLGSLMLGLAALWVGSLVAGLL